MNLYLFNIKYVLLLYVSYLYIELGICENAEKNMEQSAEFSFMDRDSNIARDKLNNLEETTDHTVIGSDEHVKLTMCIF